MQRSGSLGIVGLAVLLGAALLLLWSWTGAGDAGREPLGPAVPEQLVPALRSDVEGAVDSGRDALVEAVAEVEPEVHVAASEPFDLLELARVVVTVLDPDGAPFEGAVVYGESGYFAGEPGAPSGPLVTGSDGRVELALSPGGGSVKAFAEELPAIGKEYVGVFGEGPYAVTVQLKPTKRFRGRVLDAGSGQPIERALVAGPGVVRYGVAPVLTDADGRFELVDWPLDVYTGMTVTAAGYGQERARGAIFSGGGWELPARYGWPVVKGEQGVPYIELYLVAEKRIVGELVGWGADVLVEAEGHFLTVPQIASQDWAEARGPGKFLLEGLRSDVTHLVTISAPGRRALHVIARKGLLLDLGVIRASEQVLLRGRMVDSDGRALPHAPIEVVYAGTSEPGIEWDPKGGEVRDRDAWDGTVREIRREGFADSEGRFELPIDSSGELELLLGGEREVGTVSVLSLTGEVDRDCGDQVYRGGGSLRRFDLSGVVGGDARGPFEVTLAPNGSWRRLRFKVDSLERVSTWWFDREQGVDVVVRRAASGEVLGVLSDAELDDLSRLE